jgi:GAF domain-containing protein
VVTASTTTSESSASRLLRLMANHSGVAEIAALDAPDAERDLALRIRDDVDRRRRRETELSALVDTARDLASLSDPSGVLDAITRRARVLLGTDVSYLTLYDPERGDTFMRATDGSISAEFQAVRLSLGHGLGGLSASTRQAYWTADYFADHRFRHTGVIDSAVVARVSWRSPAPPLLVEDEFVGVLFAANRSPRPFSHDEVALLSSLAALAAESIVQVRALAETEQALAALSEALEIVRRRTAGVERAAAAHDRFADLVLAGGAADDITEALVDLLGGWAVVFDDAGVRRSEAGDAPRGPDEPATRDPLAEVTAAHPAAAGRSSTSATGMPCRSPPRTSPSACWSSVT